MMESGMEEKSLSKDKKEEGDDDDDDPAGNDVKVMKESTLRMRLKDPKTRKKISYSLFIALSFVALGMYVGQHGPTFLDIRIITNTDLESSSAFFTGGNTGYLMGSVVTGLIYDKANKTLLLFLATFLLGVSNTIVPYCTQYELMIFIRFITGVFAGCLDTGGNSDHMRVWGSEADGLMQFIHFSFSLGGVISPLFAEPFLASKDVNNNNTMRNESLPSNSSLPAKPLETRVQYVFIITGVFIMLTSLPFFIIYLRDRNKPEEKKVEKRKFSQRNVPVPLLVLMLVGMCLFYFLYCSVEDTFFSFLMTFLVEEYDSVSKSKGAFTTAVAWASFAISRFLMIFMTKFFTSVQLVLIQTTSMGFAFVAFTALAYYGVVDALVFFAAFAALSLSGVFPAGFSWMETKMFKVTGVISSCILVSSSLGSIVNPLVLGFLMETFDNMWFCYLLLINTFLLYSLMILLMAFSRFYIDRKYGSMRSSELNIPESDEPSSPGDYDTQNGDVGVEVTFIQ